MRVKLIELNKRVKFITRDLAVALIQKNPQKFSFHARGKRITMIQLADTNWTPCFRNTEAAVYPPWPGWEQ